ncbi:asparagine synthase C-terminal domain-containing protein [Streptomyces tsukubensis]|uniref:Asparagine synthetase domain-containing protein n=1 Tax=Streptomyces tsukubensis TaxID=83656 RepID=A0A1V4AF49_9ACTN|nr:asparagine synthase-related protein [Streptomyces tsukubensis]OON82197.1 hypothetical protein B1H18_03930 [Streptomyces tsukubensis]QFR92685.1 hypothetical protein GBW32_05955 [Streptomyces tsukubensis]
MLESHLPVRDVYWHAGDSRPGGPHAAGSCPGGPHAGDPRPGNPPEETAAGRRGRFASIQRDGDRVTATRDRLGLNKLYVAFHPDRGVVAANYLRDLVRAGIDFTDTYAVPAGCAVTLDPDRRTGTVLPFPARPSYAGVARAPSALAATVRGLLDEGMRHLAATHQDTATAVCLSGGADSSVVAAYAHRHFPRTVAYSYTFGDGPLSEDAAAARHVAAHLGMDFRLVRADRQRLIDALYPAIVNGQDWRDFNVHAAVVNEVLAASIAGDHPRGALVFTGDLMNEFLADYTPVPHAGVLYYRLPNLPPGLLRSHLTRGLQTGDREVGVFAAHGLTVVQPYCWAADELLSLPDPVNKPWLMTHLARRRLPADILNRPKVRAQIGDPSTDTGVLHHLIKAGIDRRQLEVRFRHALGIPSAADLRRVIRGGVHRPVPHTPAEGAE